MGYGSFRYLDTVCFTPTDEKPLKDVMEKFKLERSPQKINKKIGAGGQESPHAPLSDLPLLLEKPDIINLKRA